MSQKIALKGLILCAGKGTRLRPLTDSIPKPLIPIANRPMVFYVLDQIRETGIKDIGIVVSPNTVDQLKNAIGDGSHWDANITYIMQNEARGLAHAVKASRQFLKESSFLMFLGDNLLEGSVVCFVEEFRKSHPAALVLLKEIQDPRLFGVAELDDSGRVTRLVEKPKEPRSNLAMVGVYLFTPRIHEAIDNIKLSWRGEYEITDATQWLMEHGEEIRSFILEGWWLDAGKKDDLLRANHVVLEEIIEDMNEGHVDSASRISGKAEIKKGATLINCIVNGPVSIGEKCALKNSVIGPFVSVGNTSCLENVKIDNSIVLEGCRIENVPYLRDSILGNKVNFSGTAEGSKAVSLFIGSDSVLQF